ncbi:MULTISPECIES: glycosyltransferase family 2 protein [Halorhodospira]|uniref:glycosyltransferase family 2 protein n=1 Tax=Halorhodospira TaxID=85108 RepID=UPI0019137418|nr:MULTISPECIES: glycosyltransferase [Halorhodospira]MBK5936112.1 glycosyl transferase [Halorhodospira halophila]
MTPSVPRVSVVMPARNCSPFIAEAIDSVLSQEEDSLEVLVVDDGSTDETAAIAASYGEPVRVLHTSKPGSGAAAARNVGLRAAAGECIAFLDGDDVWLPGKLAWQQRVLADHLSVELVCARGARWEVEDAAAGWRPCIPPMQELRYYPSGWLYTWLLLRPAWVWTSTVMLRRSLFERVGYFDETLRLGQDYDYWLRCSRETPIRRIAHVMALYRQHPGNATRTPRARNFELEILERALDRWGPTDAEGGAVGAGALRRRRAALHFRFAYQHFWAGNARLAAPSFYRALIGNPMAWRVWCYALLATVSRLVGWCPSRSGVT